jgi:hypothetical protein
MSIRRSKSSLANAALKLKALRHSTTRGAQADTKGANQLNQRECTLSCLASLHRTRSVFGVRAAQAAALVVLCRLSIHRGKRHKDFPGDHTRWKDYQSGGLCRTHSKGFAKLARSLHLIRFAPFASWPLCFLWFKGSLSHCVVGHGTDPCSDLQESCQSRSGNWRSIRRAWSL